MSIEMKALNIGGLSPVLVSDGQDLVLIDTSIPGNTEQLLQVIRDTGFDPAHITHLILTHQDIDHMGCARDLKARHPGILVMAHALEAPYIEGRQTAIKMAKLPEGHEIRRAYEKRTLPIDRLLHDAELLPLCGGIRVIHTPGHTPGHVCLLIESLRALVAGDALRVDNGQLLGPHPEHTQHMDEAKRSLSALRDQRIDQIVAFHGGPFVGDVCAALAAIG